VYLDFGLLHPNAVTALTQMATTRRRCPRWIGKFAARVAMPLDALLRLHQQLQQMLVGLRSGRGVRLEDVKG
jgi:hypothetical protein